MITRRRSPLALPLCAVLALTGCGGAAPEAAAPKEEPLPSTPEATLDLVERAESEIRLALGESTNRALSEPAQSGGASAAQGNATPPAAPPPPPPAPAPAEAPPADRDERSRITTASEADAASSAVKRDDPCSNACRALASMERATEHLCSLAGSADARCEGARARARNAGARVREKCPSCAS